MVKNETINVKGTEITIIQNDSEDFISLTDMANSNKVEAWQPTFLKIGYETDTL